MASKTNENNSSTRANTALGVLQVAQERIVAIRLSLVQFSQLNCKAGQVRTVSYGKQPQLNPKFELRAAGYLSRSLVTGGAPLMQMAKNPVKFREGSPGADFVLPKQICL